VLTYNARFSRIFVSDLATLNGRVRRMRSNNQETASKTRKLGNYQLETAASAEEEAVYGARVEVNFKV
jgi:hypothetical protein